MDTASPWWVVQLQERFIVSRVALMNRADCCGKTRPFHTEHSRTYMCRLRVYASKKKFSSISTHNTKMCIPALELMSPCSHSRCKMSCVAAFLHCVWCETKHTTFRCCVYVYMQCFLGFTLNTHLIHTGRATPRKANGTCVGEWECSHCTQQHHSVCVRICARASCVDEA